MIARLGGRFRPLPLILLAFWAMGWWPGPASAQADGCTRIDHEGRGYVVCEVAAGDDLRIWHTTPEGGLYGSFARIDADLARGGERLGFAMNGGMYHRDRAPVGLLMVEGKELSPLLTGASGGNFGLLPNGVFCVTDDRFAVMETRAFARTKPACRFATQSGPMLVIGGKLHPRFIPDSDSRYIRNGVGVRPGGGSAIFAISDQPVNFHEFARFFRDRLGTPDALYLDGKISRLYAPSLRRNDIGFPMGPIIGTVVAD